MRRWSSIVVAGLCGWLILLPVSARAAETVCHLTFNLKSWSVFYKSGKGAGTVKCDNGQTAAVAIRAQGGGLTFGKSKVVNGHGTFTKVADMSEIFGNYASSEAHAGAKDSAAAGALWKGNVGLTLSGTGEGWNLGFAFGSFKILRKS